MLRGRFPPGPSRLVGPPMPTPGPTWAPSAGGRGRTVFAAENPPPLGTRAQLRPALQGPLLWGLLSETQQETQLVPGRSRPPGRTLCPSLLLQSSPHWAVPWPHWKRHQKPVRRAPLLASAGPRAGRVEAGGDPGQGVALRHLQATWPPAQHAAGRKEGVATPGLRNPLQGPRKTPARPQSSCRQRPWLVPRGALSDLSPEETGPGSPQDGSQSGSFCSPRHGAETFSCSPPARGVHLAGRRGFCQEAQARG